MYSRLPLAALLLCLLLPLGLATDVVADEEKGKEPTPKGKDKGDEKAKPAKPAAPAKYGVAKLQQEIEALRERLVRLAEQANKDPRERLIEEYANYSLEQFTKQKKRVKVRDLVDFIFDEEADYNLVRMKAVNVILAVNEKYLDPDLSTERKSSGSPSPRSLFCTRHVVKKLADKDRNSRVLADKLITDLWGGKPATLLGPRNYKAQKKHSKTWGPAISDWKKYLKRR
ncbi:MAG: hypothetical protein QNJ98_10205 [Planctomycetota bacterium]|nr:hypothetical protein [Planctomycetota bacterium]